MDGTPFLFMVLVLDRLMRKYIKEGSILRSEFDNIAEYQVIEKLDDSNWKIQNVFTGETYQCNIDHLENHYWLYKKAKMYNVYKMSQLRK